MDLGKCGAQIVEQIGPGARQRRLPSHEDVVVTVFSKKGKDFTCGFFEPAARPVAGDRIADLAGYGKARAGREIVAAGAGLQHEAAQRRFVAASRRQKFRTFL